MVDKRTMVFLTLATMVWAFIATSLVAYYYVEQVKYREQVSESQQLSREIAENYETATSKRNLVSVDYGALLGEYQMLAGKDCSLLLSKYEKLLSNLDSNYTSMLGRFPELNATYDGLSSELEMNKAQSEVTRGNFSSLLNAFWKLFSALTLKESEQFVGELSLIDVNLCIDYGNQTSEWHNTSISPSATLFDLTQEVADIEYSYSAAMEPGHIFLTSINDQKAGYWVWYYWDGIRKDWTFGPLGCDAWTLRDHETFKWSFIPS